MVLKFDLKVPALAEAGRKYNQKDRQRIYKEFAEYIEQMHKLNILPTLTDFAHKKGYARGTIVKFEELNPLKNIVKEKWDDHLRRKAASPEDKNAQGTKFLLTFMRVKDDDDSENAYPPIKITFGDE